MNSTHEDIIIPLEKLDFRGHRHAGRWAEKNGVSAFRSVLTRKDGTVVAHTSFHNLFSCSYCDTYPGMEENEDGSYTAKTACSSPEGVISTFKLNIPSGRLAVADSLWSDSKLPNPELTIKAGVPDFNSALGKALYYKQMEAVGIAYGYVGNSSPSLYINDLTGELFIANPGFADVTADDYNEEEVDDDGQLPTPAGWRKLADITTDLWAYSITDYQHYLNHDGNPDAEHVAFPEVPAGTYTFTHYADQADFKDWGGLVIFAKADHQPLTSGTDKA